jgi:hypothetical protein
MSTDAPFKSIHDLIVNYLVELLTQKLMVEGLNPDAIPTEIRYGRVQENVQKKRISLFIHLGDPDELSDTAAPWVDTVASRTEEWSGYPDGEIGGNGPGFFARRLSCEINVSLVKSQENRQDARSVATYVLKATQDAINRSGCCHGTQLVDDFGEVALQFKAIKIQSVEQGGPPTSLSYRIKLYISVLTEMP